MQIETFKVEKWMNEYEKEALYDIAQTCVKNISIDELFEIAQVDRSEFLDELTSKALGYGHIQGSPELKEGVCSLYETIKPENVISTIGAAGANHLVFYSLINPGDQVVSIIPTYQQLYSIPKSFGADVKILELRTENKFLPDLDELRSLVNKKIKLICLNNPNNPSGALINNSMLEDIVEIARDADAYLLCDEVYRGLNHCDPETVSIADIYEKGISTSSMSKVFSLAGLRLGWVASKSKEVIEQCLSHREYNMISCAMSEETLAALALKNANKIKERNRKIICENLEILDQWVKSQSHITYVKPKAGTTALLYYDFDMSSQRFCDELSKKKGVFLTPGFCFELENCARIGYAGDKQVLIEGLMKISEYISEIDMK